MVPRARGQRDQVGDRAALADPAPRKPSRGCGVGQTGIGTARRAGREGRAVGAAPGSQPPPGGRSHRPQTSPRPPRGARSPSVSLTSFELFGTSEQEPMSGESGRGELGPLLCFTSNLPGSSVHGIAQARILEWVAISPFRGVPNPGKEPASSASPALQVDSSLLSHLGSPIRFPQTQNPP